MRAIDASADARADSRLRAERVRKHEDLGRATRRGVHARQQHGARPVFSAYCAPNRGLLQRASCLWLRSATLQRMRGSTALTTHCEALRAYRAQFIMLICSVFRVQS
jgi:hypothetical protein